MSVALIFGLIDGAKRLYQAFSGKPVPPQIDQVISAGKGLHDAIRAGVVTVTDDDGTPLSPAAFDAKFAAWELAQEQARQGAASRLEDRHATSGPDGEP